MSQSPWLSGGSSSAATVSAPAVAAISASPGAYPDKSYRAKSKFVASAACWIKKEYDNCVANPTLYEHRSEQPRANTTEALTAPEFIWPYPRLGSPALNVVFKVSVRVKNASTDTTYTVPVVGRSNFAWPAELARGVEHEWRVQRGDTLEWSDWRPFTVRADAGTWTITDETAIYNRLAAKAHPKGRPADWNNRKKQFIVGQPLRIYMERAINQLDSSWRAFTPPTPSTYTSTNFLTEFLILQSLVRMHEIDGGAAEFTGTISGTTLTVSSIEQGRLCTGQTIRGYGVTTTTISAQLTGTTGSTGTYTVAASQTVSAATSMKGSHATSSTYLEEALRRMRLMTQGGASVQFDVGGVPNNASTQPQQLRGLAIYVSAAWDLLYPYLNGTDKTALLGLANDKINLLILNVNSFAPGSGSQNYADGLLGWQGYYRSVTATVRVYLSYAAAVFAGDSAEMTTYLSAPNATQMQTNVGFIAPRAIYNIRRAMNYLCGDGGMAAGQYYSSTDGFLSQVLFDMAAGLYDVRWHDARPDARDWIRDAAIAYPLSTTTRAYPPGDSIPNSANSIPVNGGLMVSEPSPELYWFMQRDRKSVV